MCVGLVASSTEEMAARSIAYHAHGTPDGNKYCCYPWLVCHVKSAMHPLLAQARPRMINHLTSKYFGIVQLSVVKAWVGKIPHMPYVSMETIAHGMMSCDCG